MTTETTHAQYSGAHHRPPADVAVQWGPLFTTRRFGWRLSLRLQRPWSSKAAGAIVAHKSGNNYGGSLIKCGGRGSFEKYSTKAVVAKSYTW